MKRELTTPHQVEDGELKPGVVDDQQEIPILLEFVGTTIRAQYSLFFSHTLSHTRRGVSNGMEGTQLRYSRSRHHPTSSRYCIDIFYLHLKRVIQQRHLLTHQASSINSSFLLGCSPHVLSLLSLWTHSTGCVLIESKLRCLCVEAMVYMLTLSETSPDFNQWRSISTTQNHIHITGRDGELFRCSTNCRLWSCRRQYQP